MCSPLVMVLAAVLSGEPQSQYQIGDRIVLIEETKVTDGHNILALLDCGNPLIVEDVQGSRILVNSSPPGWIEETSAVPLASATKYFEQKLKSDKNQPKLLYALGRCLAVQGDDLGARECFDHAVALKPDVAAYDLARGRLYLDEGEYPSAIEDFNRAVKLEPTNAQPYRWRAAAYVGQGDYEKALADYNQAVRTDPGNSAVINDRAWMLATCPDERFRNGPQAVADAWLAASRANWKTYNRLVTLAAAYAETGDFEQAVRWQQLAIALAPPDRSAALESMLKLYEAQHAYREIPITN